MMQGKVIVITGAGAGLGKALVEAFLAQGCKVAGIGRRDPKPGQSTSPNYCYIKADVADPAQVKSAFDRIRAEQGSIDVLFNNAAVYPRVSFLEESADDFSKALAVNLGGVANCAKAALPIMIQQGRGRIYNIGSWADRAPIAKSAVYSASKGGLHALTKAIAADLAGIEVDVQVHEWIPGHMNTQMSEFTGMDPQLPATWGVGIVQRDDASSPNCIFEGEHEWQPPESLRGRVKRRLLFWRHRRR